MSFSFERLSERERRMVLFGAIAGVLILIVAIVLPLDRSVAKAQERIARKQADLAWMQTAAPELVAAGPSAPARAITGIPADHGGSHGA